MVEWDSESQRKIVLRLYSDFENICFQRKLKLQRPIIRLTQSNQHWGEWNEENRTLSLSQRLLLTGTWDQVLEVLKHEMAHMISEGTHGQEFQFACEKLGVAPWARNAKTDLESTPLGAPIKPLDPALERLQERIRKLFSLAQSSNLHEAELAMKKAREISERYQMESFSQNKQPEYHYWVFYSGKKRLPGYFTKLTALLNDFFFVRVIFVSYFSVEKLDRFQSIEFVGTQQSVETAEYVFHFLLHKIETLWRDYQSQTQFTHYRKNGFILGVLNGFRKKLETPVASAPTGGYALVERHLDQLLRLRHPRSQISHRSGGRLDNQAYREGVRQGAQIIIHKGIRNTKKESRHEMLPKHRH